MESPHKLPVKAAITALIPGLPGAFLAAAGPSAAAPTLPSGDAQPFPPSNFTSAPGTCPKRAA